VSISRRIAIAACVTACLCLNQIASAATNNAAPADEYFGKMKMSYLGIDNSLRDAYVMAGDHTVYPSVIQKVKWAEDAFMDWRRQFPNDPQLPRTIFFLFGAYSKIWTADGQTHALQYVEQLRDKYGSTYFGKLIRADLAKGMTLHVYAAALPCWPEPGEATPTPVPGPSPDPAHNIKVQYEVAPCATPTPTPTAPPIETPPPIVPTAPGPIPTAAPSAIPPTAPSANPTAAPSGIPTAAPSATPSPAPTSKP
jgi:hypothetical protein